MSFRTDYRPLDAITNCVMLYPKAAAEMPSSMNPTTPISSVKLSVPRPITRPTNDMRKPTTATIRLGTWLTMSAIDSMYPASVSTVNDDAHRPASKSGDEVVQVPR